MQSIRDAHDDDVEHDGISAFEDDLNEEPSALLRRLRADVRLAASILLPSEQRILVDLYYQSQESRKRAFNQARAAALGPNEVVILLSAHMLTLEKTIVSALDVSVRQTPLGRWCLAQYGIGPVLTAGLLADIDITKAKTASAIWRYCGLDPTSIWGKGMKRPWNARLKVLCYKIGVSFLKFSRRPECVYGHLYAGYKQREIALNDSGQHLAEAARMVATHAWKETTMAIHWYTGCYPAGTTAAIMALPLVQREPYLARVRVPQGHGLPMLPPAHLDARARRHAVKIFLSHYFEVAYTLHYGTPPAPPYIFLQDPARHTHRIPVPHWPFSASGEEPKTSRDPSGASV